MSRAFAEEAAHVFSGNGILVYLFSTIRSTPELSFAIRYLKAAGGLVLTASHNPKQWNALKLLNSRGEFLSAADGEKILELASKRDRRYAEIQSLGICSTDDSCIQKHIAMVLQLPLVDVAAIRNAKFTVAIDAVNSTGGIAIPMLLKELGVNKIISLVFITLGHGLNQRFQFFIFQTGKI